MAEALTVFRLATSSTLSTLGVGGGGIGSAISIRNTVDREIVTLASQHGGAGPTGQRDRQPPDGRGQRSVRRA